MFQHLTGWHELVILAVVLLVLGSAKLPALAKNVGQSTRILKAETADPQRGLAMSVSPSDAPDGPTALDVHMADIAISVGAGMPMPAGAQSVANCQITGSPQPRRPLVAAEPAT